MLAAGPGEVSRTSDRDRSAGRELVNDHARETRHRFGQEHRLGADAYDVAPLGERRDQLAVEAVIGLELRGTRWLQRFLRQCGARTQPMALLIFRKARLMRRQRESAPPLGEAPIRDKPLDERGKALRR